MLVARAQVALRSDSISADTLRMSAIGAVVILVAGCAALWRFARWDAKGQRARRDNRQADLELLRRDGIEPPATAVPRGMWIVVAGGPIAVVLVVVAPSWAKVLVAVVSGTLLGVMLRQDQKNHNLARRRAMETAAAVLSEMPPEERQRFVDAMERVWRGELTPSMRALRRRSTGVA